jgi:hypothetical protein
MVGAPQARSSVEVFDRIDSGEITPEEGAKLLTPSDERMLRKPAWLPKWLYVAGVIIIAAVFAPVMGVTRDRSSSP